LLLAKQDETAETGRLRLQRETTGRPKLKDLPMVGQAQRLSSGKMPEIVMG